WHGSHVSLYSDIQPDQLQPDLLKVRRLQIKAEEFVKRPANFFEVELVFFNRMKRLFACTQHMR
ncbi:MAG: hypothetical protein ACREDL_13835, partial [Bradyrhizobium sp.]